MVTKTPRPYQFDAMDQIDATFTGGARRCLITLATGLGKTIIASHYVVKRWLARFPDKRVLFFAHTRDILRQARKEFNEVLGDETRTGILSSTDCINPDAQILFVTLQTMEGLMSKIHPSEVSLVIDDEAHHAWAPTYKPILDYYGQCAFLLGMTATPERGDSKDITEIFGESVFDFSLAEGISRGWLAHVTYKVLFDNISITKLRALVKEVVGEGRRVSRRQINDSIFLPTREEEVSRIVTEHRRKDEKTIHFCQGLEHLEVVRTFHPNARVYHSILSDKEQRDVFTAFQEGDLREILVVDKFNEGVNIPDAELLVFRRATDSRTVWLQQLGRGTRRTAEKRRVTILDFVANCDRVAAVAEFGREIGIGFNSEFTRPESTTIDELNFEITFSQEFRDLALLLERLDVALYSTIEEASAAAQKLGVVGVHGPKGYKRNYLKDPRLPSNPDGYYGAAAWIRIGKWSGYLHGKPSRRGSAEAFRKWLESTEET